MPFTVTVFWPDVGLVPIKLPEELLDEELELLDEELELLLEDELELLDEEELELEDELDLPEDELELDELLELEEEEDEATSPPPQPVITEASNKDAVPSTRLLGTHSFDVNTIKGTCYSLNYCEFNT
jgi:hypothetical protein